ncbi:unnamed protein product, partial [Effrenium voratum]
LSTENCKMNASPSKVRPYWQPRPEEASYARLSFVARYAEKVLGAPEVRNLDQAFQDELQPSEGDGGTGSSDSAACAAENPAEVEVLYNRTVNFRFDDPFLPFVLREVIHDPEHPSLLTLCEAGIPAWAVFLPKFTGLYHRYMRHVIAAVVVLISCLSMLLGFYDLYKRIPLVRTLLKQSLGPLSSRLEELVVARLSVLLAWILPYSGILRFLKHFWDFVKQFCIAVFSFATIAFSACAQLLSPGASLLLSPVMTAATAGRSLFQPLVSTVKAFVQLRGTGSGGLLKTEFNMVRQAFMSVYNATCFLGASIARHQASILVCWTHWQHRQRKRIGRLTSERPRLVALLVVLAALFCATSQLQSLAVRVCDRLLWEAAIAMTRLYA